MTVSKYKPLNKIVIWEPRWKDRKVLIAKFKVGEENEVLFTGVPGRNSNSMGDKPYYLSGATIRNYPLTDNGKIACYEVPVDELELLERSE